VQNAQSVSAHESGSSNQLNDTAVTSETPQNEIDYNSTSNPFGSVPLIVNASTDLDSIFVNKTDEESGNSETMSLPWRIFDFFLSQMGHKSSTTTSSPVGTIVTDGPSVSNETVPSNSSSAEQSITDMPNVTSIAPLLTTVVVTCDANQCREFSTDTILRARLCCLAEEVGRDGETTTSGCRTYSKQTCDQMMPLIKCCLKDFSELLANFFNQESSNQRQRKASFAG
jgi:hypothetical protein